MTRLEHSAMDGKRPANGHSNPAKTSQPASLGPVDPSWLAKLSTTLGIQPARTVAPLLMSIWPGVHTAAICCREACAYLMQADMHHVAMPQLESNVRVAFRQRGVSVHPSLSIRSEIETDSHFIKEQGPNGGDLMVRLDKTSLPAPAVASLYLNGTGERMLPPERALYQAAMHLTWPRALTDDDEYLCCQISELLLEDVERVGIDRNLPRHAMHLTEVGGALRQRSEFDPRLAVIFPKGQVAKSRRPRLSEFLGKEDLKPFFRVVESRLRQSEKVVTLRTDVLLRSLGPMASVLQKSLCPVLKDGLPQSQPELPRATNDQVRPMHAPSFPLPIPNLSDQPHPPGRKTDALGDVMSPATCRESCWSYSGRSNDPLQSRHDSVSQSFTRAQSIFMGLESASEVPIEIRNCWSTIEDDTLQHDESLLTHGAPSYPGRSFSSHRRTCGPPGPRGEGQEDPSAENALLAIAPLRAVDRTGGSSATGTCKPTTEPSDFFDFGSEDMSDAGGTAVAECGEGIRGSSKPVGDGTASNGGALHAWTPALGSVPTSGSTGRANGGSTAGWNKRSDTHQSPPITAGIPVPSGTRGPSTYKGSQEPTGTNGTSVNVLLDAGNLQSVDRRTRFGLGTTTDEHATVWENGKGGAWGTTGGTRGDALPCSRSHGGTMETFPPHVCGNLGNQSDDVAAKSIWGSPASLPHGSSTAHPPIHQQQVVNGSNANYAAVLRSAQPNGGVIGNRQAPSPTDAKALTNDVIYAHLDTCGREIHSLLTPAVVDSVCDAVRRAAPRLNAPGLLQVSMGMPSTVSATMPGGALGPVDVATEFLACVNAAALTRSHVANMLEKGSDGARRALVIAGLPPGTLPSSSIAHSLTALKPMVRREVVALVDAHPGALRLSHFDEGVLCHLQRRPEPLVAAALREISRRTDLSGATNKSAYLTHWLMRFADDPTIPSLASKCAGKGGNSTSPDLRRLPRSVQSAVERLVDSSPWIDWRHFDAGVMKVLQQLASTAESDAVSELRQVEVTELSTVKNMPAYLNKCFNNRLWKVRES